MWGPETTTTVDPTKSALVKEKLGKEGGKTEQKSDEVDTAYKYYYFHIIGGFRFYEGVHDKGFT